MKLGRKPTRRDFRIPSLSRYTRMMALAPPPPTCPPPALTWPIDLNDQLGDCTIAAVAHCVQRWTAAVSPSNPRIFTGAEVLAAYEQLGGYDPNNPSTDQGCAETDVLTAWASGGIAGDRLAGYCALNITDQDELKDAVNWFGCAYLGINCPQSALDNTALWDVVPDSPIEGGHAIPIVGYNEQYFFIVSWGKLIPTTPAFLGQYLEEAYAPLSMDYISASGTTPAGLNLAQLQADMASLTSP